MKKYRGTNTGCYAADGRAVREDDRVRVIVQGHIITGTVTYSGDVFYVHNDVQGDFSPDLILADRIEIIRRDSNE